MHFGSWFWHIWLLPKINNSSLAEVGASTHVMKRTLHAITANHWKSKIPYCHVKNQRWYGDNSSLAGRILSASAIICFTYIIEQFEIQTIDCSKQIWDLLTAGYISMRKYWIIGNQTLYVYSLGSGWIWRKHVKFVSFCILDLCKKVDAERDEKDKCFVQSMNLWPKTKSWNASAGLLTAVST